MKGTEKRFKSKVKAILGWDFATNSIMNKVSLR
jgi:hypothetical protein